MVFGLTVLMSWVERHMNRLLISMGQGENDL